MAQKAQLFLLGALAAATPQPISAQDSPVATVASPATVAVSVSRTEAPQSTERRRVVIDISRFTPARGGAVQVIVKGVSGGAEKEMGRFGVFPDSPFRAATPEKTQKFSLALPADLAAETLSSLRVYLAPIQGGGEGAALEIKGAEVR